VVDVEPYHLDRLFDYAIPDDATVACGHEVRVNFAGRRRTGWVVDVTDRTGTDESRIKTLLDVRGAIPRFGADDLRLFRWVAGRWGGTLASVLRHALPRRVAAVDAAVDGWGVPPDAITATSLQCPSAAWRVYDAAALLHAVSATAAPDVPSPAFWFQPLPGDDLAALVCDLVGRSLFY
jgi:primosomal protein N' (replication factor Y)